MQQPGPADDPNAYIPTAEEFARRDRLLLIAGRYEGFDERIVEGLRPREVSVGDYVLSGGELAALVVIDAVVRLLPGTLGAEDGAADESFTDGLLEYPQYTRPREYRGMSVPDVLLSGHHADIRRWRLMQALGRTEERRPGLLAGRALTKEESALLAEYRRERAQQQ